MKEQVINDTELNSPRRSLRLFDCVCIIVGTIIGAGIFKMPAIVSGFMPDANWLVCVWIFGGFIALVGALCFAELTTTYPDRGGDYGYLKRAYDRRVGFAFSWAAFWVIRPGNIGAMALVFGEFATQIFPESLTSLQWAMLGVVTVSVINLLGVTVGKTALNLLTVAKVLGILMIVVAAFFIWKGDGNSSSPQDSSAVENSSGELDEASVTTESTADSGEANSSESESDSSTQSTWSAFWLAMVFVMFTFGGWNDIAFVANEVHEPKKNLLRALVLGTSCVLIIYLLVNYALLSGLGFDRMQSIGSQWGNPTSVLVSERMGSNGNIFFASLVCVSCLGAINAMIFTSPRIYSATAVDYPPLAWLAGSRESGNGWWRAMILQAVVTVALVWTFYNEERGIEQITAATAPYFWCFLSLTIIALIVLRRKTKGKFSGYRVPLYPITPIIFVAACFFMVYQSWVYMVDQGLWLPALLIGLWVLGGFGLSFVLKHQNQTQNTH